MATQGEAHVDQGAQAARSDTWYERAVGFLLAAALCALGWISFLTSREGFAQLVPLSSATIAAFGLQAAMISSAFFFSRVARRRPYWLCSYIATALVSITFSYVGILHILEVHVSESRRPVFDRTAFQKQSADLQRTADIVLGEAKQRVNAEIQYLSADQKLAQASVAARAIRAAEYRAKLDELQRVQANLRGSTVHTFEREDRLAEIGRDLTRTRASIALAEAQGESKDLEVGRLGERKSGLLEIKNSLENLRPSFVAADPARVEQADWEALRVKYDQFSNALSSIPGGFWQQASEKLSPPPARPVLKSTGEFFEGEDHPVLEALGALPKGGLHVIFSAVVASMFDILPLIALMGTRRKYGTLRRKLGEIPSGIGECRRWMTQVKSQIEAMEGVLPWMARCCSKFFLFKPTASADARVLEFQVFLSRLRLQMEDFMRESDIPEAVFEQLQLHLAGFHRKAQADTYKVTTKLGTAALSTYRDCMDCVEAASLSPEEKVKLRAFLDRQLGKFDEAVKKYGADSSMDDESACDSRKEQQDATKARH